MARILMVSSEAAPFAKTGGLADVLGALPKALVEAGEQVAVVIPLYRCVVLSNAKLAYERLQFAVGTHGYSADIFEQVENGVRYFFVRIPELYDRDQLYHEQGRDYADNHLRFAALCHAALGVARHIFMPDIIHCHDWQAGLLPVLLRDTYSSHPAYLGLKAIFTIHNLGYLGLFPKAALAEIGLPERLLNPDFLAFRGQISFLKGGLVFGDVLTTVSPRYAEEIQTSTFGFGLDALLRARRGVLIGILNGADYSEWDPTTDPNLPKNFDRLHMAGKRECKRTLLKEMGLPENRLDRALIGIVSRFVEQKGFDLLMQIPNELAAEEVSLVALGSGDKRVEDFFAWFQSTYPNRVAAKIGYDDGLAHRIEAGSDLSLMPSRYEPCGLNQIYSMRYGTLPIVHAIGGLDDTVDSDTGFKFSGENAYELLECVRAALRVYGTPRWAQMREAAMERDFSWQRSAAEYMRLYRRVCM